MPSSRRCTITRKNEAAIVRELSDILAIPNVATDDANIRRNAQHLLGMLERRGIRGQLLESPAGGPPAVFGELRTPGATTTIVMYAHYDGQPVVASEWKTDPWKPTPVPDRFEPESRIYARSASDDKAPIVAFLVALDALRAMGERPAVNLKFFFEGEEEQGSPHLEAVLKKHKDTLVSDGWIFCDGPRHQSGAMQVVFGVRGTLLTTFGPARTLHSGHCGNWSPNPVAILTDLLFSMRDADGNVKLAGFHDDVRPPTQSERAAAAALPDNDAELRRSLLSGADRRRWRVAIAPAHSLGELHRRSRRRPRRKRDSFRSIGLRRLPPRPESAARKTARCKQCVNDGSDHPNRKHLEFSPDRPTSRLAFARGDHRAAAARAAASWP